MFSVRFSNFLKRGVENDSNFIRAYLANMIESTRDLVHERLNMKFNSRPLDFSFAHFNLKVLDFIETKLYEELSVILNKKKHLLKNYLLNFLSDQGR